MVNMNFKPDIPKTMPETLCVAADAAGQMSIRLLNYIRTGDLDQLKGAADNLVTLRALGTKNLLSNIINCSLHDEHPLSDEERKDLYFQLVNEARGEDA